MNILALAVILALVSTVSVLGYQTATASHDPTYRTPAAPVLSISSMGTTLTLTWTVPDLGWLNSPIHYYLVEYMINNNGQWTAKEEVSAYNDTSLTITDNTANIPYTFRVTAKNLYGLGHASNTVDYMVSVKPSAPRNLTATPSNQNVELKWTAPENHGSSPITKYTIGYRIGNVNPFVPLTTVSADTTSHTVQDLRTDVQYSFLVYASNAVATGPTSNVVTAYIICCAL